MSPHVNASRNGGKRFNNSDESHVSDEVLKKVHQKIRKIFDRKNLESLKKKSETFSENFRKNRFSKFEIFRRISIENFQKISKISEKFSNFEDFFRSKILRIF